MPELQGEYIVEETKKPFNCLKCGGLVGYIKRDSRDNHNYAYLEKLQWLEDGTVRVIGLWFGYGSAACDKCGELRTWHASQQWLNDYIRKKVEGRE